MKYAYLFGKGIRDYWNYVRNFRVWGEVRDPGQGILARGQAAHPDIKVKQAFKQLAAEKQWTEFWRHQEGLGNPKATPDASLLMARQLYMLRRSRRNWKKARFLKGKKRENAFTNK